jgi:hypothetical protein
MLTLWQDNWTPLLVSVEHGRAELVDVFLAAGANANVATKVIIFFAEIDIVCDGVTA